jgi:predicted HicB family RNase H-like nuclease
MPHKPRPKSPKQIAREAVIAERKRRKYGDRQARTDTHCQVRLHPIGKKSLRAVAKKDKVALNAWLRDVIDAALVARGLPVGPPQDESAS